MELENLGKNKLAQCEYEQILIFNRRAFELIQEFIKLLDEVLVNNVKAIGVVNHIDRIYDFKKIIDAQSRICSEKIKIIIELGKQQYIEEDGQRIIERYYYDDVYNVIIRPVSQQIIILKIYTKKIIKLIQNPKLKKDFQKCRAGIRKKLDKLEKEQKEYFNKS